MPSGPSTPSAVTGRQLAQLLRAIADHLIDEDKMIFVIDHSQMEIGRRR